jgi:1,5-anhydro-D-fructose reductase (1,5-anhydro-D-mannitol-forming)
MQNQIRNFPLAICGLGRFSTKRILPALEKSQNFKLIAIINRSEIDENSHLDILKYSSLSSYLETNPSGAIYIATPNYLHAQQAIESMSVGLHVICEKPMAITGVDCQLMLDVANINKTQLFIGHMLRYSPVIAVAKNWIRNQILGKLQAIDTIFHYNLPVTDRSWALTKNASGGGALIDAGIHCIDTIRFLTDDQSISELTANIDNNMHSDGIERKAKCHFKTADIIGLVHVDATRSYQSMLTITGDKGSIIIENFAATWGQASIKFYTHDGYLQKAEYIDVSNIYLLQLNAFAAAIQGQHFSPPTSAAENVKIVEAAYAIATQFK